MNLEAVCALLFVGLLDNVRLGSAEPGERCSSLGPETCGPPAEAPRLWYHGVPRGPEVLELHLGSPVTLTPQIILPASRDDSALDACEWTFASDIRLPAGLELHNRIGIISGTPRQLSSSQSLDYHIIARCDLEGEDAWTTETSLAMRVIRYGLIRTVAGTGTAGPTPLAGGIGYAVQLDWPWSLCSHRGKLYIGQVASILELDYKSGHLKVFLGKPGQEGSSGVGSPKEEALVGRVAGLVVIDEELYFSDWSLNVVRKVGLPGSSLPGIVQHVAGRSGSCASDAKDGDGGQAGAAGLCSPWGLAARSGHKVLYISNCDKHNIRAVDLTTNKISTLAGTGDSGFSGDGGSAIQAKLYFPKGPTEADGILYVADHSNYRVRCIDLRQQPHVIDTCAGGGSETRHGAPAKQWDIGNPYDVAVGPNGFLYIASDTSNSVLAVNLKEESKPLIRLVGTGSSGSGKDHIAFNQSPLKSPYAVAVHQTKIYVAEQSGQRVRSAAALGLALRPEETAHHARSDAERILGPWQSTCPEQAAAPSSDSHHPSLHVLHTVARQYISPAFSACNTTPAVVPPMASGLEQTYKFTVSIKFTLTFFLRGALSGDGIVVGIASPQSLQRMLQRNEVWNISEKPESFIGSAFEVEVLNTETQECSISKYMPPLQAALAPAAVTSFLRDVNTLSGEVHGSSAGASGFEYKLEGLEINGVRIYLDLGKTPMAGMDTPMRIFMASCERDYYIEIPAEHPPEAVLI